MTAEKLTVALENMPLGEPWAEPLAAAEAANEATRAAAEAELSPRALVPTSADTMAQYGALIGQVSAANCSSMFAGYHERSLVSHPELARLFRSYEATSDVAAAAAQLAAPAHDRETHAAAAARAAGEARANYMLAIASHIASIPGHELAKPAKALIACADLSKRLAAERARREAHAAVELERAAAQRKAAARVVRDRTAERVREAERAAADAAQIAGVTAAAYRKLRAEWFVERLRASGLHELRAGDGLFGVADLILTAGGISLQQLERYEAALERHEAADEAS